MFTLSTVIGYYVHHQGRGHLHRALAIAAHAGPDDHRAVHPSPPDWVAGRLGRAGRRRRGRTRAGDHGRRPAALRAVRRTRACGDRMSTLSAWIGDTRPDAVVVDVSVEVALLARLHGVPVLTMAQPGRRRDPAAHPGLRDQRADPGALAGRRRPDLAGRPGGGRQAHRTSGRSAGSPSSSDPAVPTPGAVLLLNGIGGQSLAGEADQARAATPAWDWAQLGGPGGTWTDNPWPVLTTAAVIVSHCGQNAVADIAAARRPAILIPQRATVRRTAEPRPRGAPPDRRARPWCWTPGRSPAEWPALLEQAEALDGAELVGLERRERARPGRAVDPSGWSARSMA